MANQPSIDSSIAKSHPNDIRKSNNTKLQMAIADLWHCENFPDRAVESVRFRLVIKYARLVGNDFRIPNRRDVGGPLLKLNYNSCYAQNKIDLMKEVSPFVCILQIVTLSYQSSFCTFISSGRHIWFVIYGGWCHNQANAFVQCACYVW